MKVVILNTTNKDNYFYNNYKGDMIEIKRMKDFSDDFRDSSKYIIYPLSETDYRKVYGHRFTELIIDKGCKSKHCAKYLKRSQLLSNKHYVCKMSGRIRRNRLHKMTSVQILKGKDIKDKFDLYQEYVSGKCFTIDVIYNGSELLYYNAIEKSAIEPYFKFPNIKNHEVIYKTSKLTTIQESIITEYVRELSLNNMGVLNIDMIGNKIIEVNFRPAGYLTNRKIGIHFLNNYVNLFNHAHNSKDYKRIIPINVNENLYTNPSQIGQVANTQRKQPQTQNKLSDKTILYVLLVLLVLYVSIIMLILIK